MPATIWYGSLLVAICFFVIGLLGDRSVIESTLRAAIAFLFVWSALALGHLLYRWAQQTASGQRKAQEPSPRSPSNPEQKADVTSAAA
ncbi:MAG: hypothetical protein N2561_05500 [Bacteroidetes bacterium]|nr:hypothetical protein [Rhodothermia bacterium]MCS7154865.1 hypothetical protein [Bacteroidota bacterium]MCX7906977.1 hypothetical protein [Bacteroidota bacterium]MDW8137659.1 hypothetical protein [Bacteroidota bacterium]MDW8285387.1 hypothetical protein [Bacteroidota bacterium]